MEKYTTDFEPEKAVEEKEEIEFYNEEGDSSTIVAKNGAKANNRKRPKRIKSHKNKPPNASLPKDNQEDIDVEQEKEKNEKLFKVVVVNYVKTVKGKREDFPVA